MGNVGTYIISFSVKDETKDCNAFGQNEIKVEIQLSDVTQTDFLPPMLSPQMAMELETNFTCPTFPKMTATTSSNPSASTTAGVNLFSKAISEISVGMVQACQAEFTSMRFSL